MLEACVKCGDIGKARDVFEEMRQLGRHRNTVIYATMIKGFGTEKDLVSALRLFRDMPTEGVPYNTITYNSVLEACIKCGDLTTAEQLLQEMLQPESHIEPDLITFSTLIKGHCQIGNLDKALCLTENVKSRGLCCDELVYNTLMDGCVKVNDITTGIGLFEEMVQCGLNPSIVTSSILARLYQRAGFKDWHKRVLDLFWQYGLDFDNPREVGRSRAPLSYGGYDRRGSAGSSVSSAASNTAMPSQASHTTVEVPLASAALEAPSGFGPADFAGSTSPWFCGNCPCTAIESSVVLPGSMSGGSANFVMTMAGMNAAGSADFPLSLGCFQGQAMSQMALQQQLMLQQCHEFEQFQQAQMQFHQLQLQLPVVPQHPE